MNNKAWKFNLIVRYDQGFVRPPFFFKGCAEEQEKQVKFCPDLAQSVLVQVKTYFILPLFNFDKILKGDIKRGDLLFALFCQNFVSSLIT